MEAKNASSVEGEEIPCDLTMKLALIGDSSVGKTCLLNRYIQGSFSAEYYTTIGIDYRNKIETIDEKIWDTAGQERFRAITKSYLRDVAGVLLVFDITMRSSFNNIATWIKQIEESGCEDMCCVLVGTHGDVATQRQVTDEEIECCASSLNYKYFVTSAVTGDNVEKSFQAMAKLILSKSKKEEKQIKSSPVVVNDMKKDKKTCAC